MPFIYLPEYTLADSQKGKCLAAQYSGLQTQLLLGCIELSVISGGEGDPIYDLPKQLLDNYTHPHQAVGLVNPTALKIVEIFDIRNFMDWLSIRPMIERLYGSFAVWDDTEYVRFQDRWYIREWVKQQYKKPKGEFGIVLNLDDGSFCSMAVAVDGTEFKQLKNAAALYKNMRQAMRSKDPSLRAYSDQKRWKKMMEIYSGYDLYRNRERSALVNLCAIDALGMAQNLMFMSPANREQQQHNNINGYTAIMELLEMAAVQTRNRDPEKRIYVERASTQGLKNQCKTASYSAEMAAKLIAFYRPDLVRTTKKKTVKSK